MNLDHVPRLVKIHNYFGVKHQVKKLAEECREFLDSKAKEEIADVLSVALQIYHTDAEVRELFAKKLSRTESRINNGYYKEEREA
jgi:predicted house-cleaning noncanonical NTP pyrophosphatase (MazG superfamily)